MAEAPNQKASRSNSSSVSNFPAGLTPPSSDTFRFTGSGKASTSTSKATSRLPSSSTFRPKSNANFSQPQGFNPPTSNTFKLKEGAINPSQQRVNDTNNEINRELMRNDVSPGPFKSVFGTTAANRQTDLQKRESEFSGQTIGMPERPLETIGMPEKNLTSSRALAENASPFFNFMSDLRNDTSEFAGEIGSAFMADVTGEIQDEEDKASEDNMVKPIAQGFFRGFGDITLGIADKMPGISSYDVNIMPEDEDERQLMRSLTGEETEEFNASNLGKEVAGIFGNVERGDEVSGLANLGYSALGIGIGSLDFVSGGGSSKIIKNTLDLDNPTIDALMGAIKGNADVFVKKTDFNEIKTTLRELSQRNIPDKELDNLAKDLAKSEDVTDVVKNTERYEAYTKAANDVETISNAAKGDVEDLAKAKNTKEVDEVLSRSSNELNRLYSRKNADDVKKALVKAGSRDDVIKSLREGAQKSLEDRRYTSRMKAAFPDITIIGGQRIIRSTDDLYKQASREVAEDLDGVLLKIKDGKWDDLNVARSYAATDELNRMAASTDDLVEKQRLYRRAGELANETSKELVKMGRGLQAAGAMSRLSPSSLLRSAEKRLEVFNNNLPAFAKKRQLTTKQKDFILKEAEEIKKLDNGFEKSARASQLQDYINRLAPSSWGERINAIWRANLLTGIGTSGLNLGANLAHAGTIIAKQVPAVFFDKMGTAMFGNERTTAFSLPEKQAIVDGFEKGWKYLKTGFDERNVAEKLNKGNVSFGQGKSADLFQAYSDGVFRLMGSMDQPFYYGALNMSLRGQAKAKAINEGIARADRAKFIDNLIEDPTEEMIRYATADAQTAVFQNETLLGKKLNEIRNLGTSAKYAIPFSTTPSAVATEVINYTPAGLIGELIMTAGKRGPDKRKMVDALAKSTTGTAPMYLGYELYKNGNLQLGYPEDQREAELNKAEGRGNYSIQLMGEWIPAETFGPLGALVMIGGSFARNQQKEGSPGKAMQRSIMEVAAETAYDTILIAQESSPLPSLFDAAKMMEDPKRYGKEYLGRLVSGFIPRMVHDIAESTDSLDRKVTSDSGNIVQNGYEEITEQIKKGIPGLRQTLQPQVDVLGGVRESEGIGKFINPIRSEKATVTEVSSEFRRLHDAGFRISPTRLGGSNGYESISDSGNVNLVNLTGTLIRNNMDTFLDSPKYQKMSDEEKVDLIDDMVKDVKNYTRAVTAIEETVDITSYNELRQKLISMEEDDLITNQVRQIYEQLGGKEIIERLLPDGGF